MAYDFILITVGQDKTTDKLIKQSDINKYYSKDDIDVWVSLFSYNEEAVIYFQKNGRLKGFRSDMSINYLPYDIDSDDFEQACLKQKHLLIDLKAKNIYSYRVSFSGKKGFHTIIPSQLFGGFKPSSVLPAQMLSLAKSLTSTEFDRAVYSHLRMFRLYGTKHPKSGLYKIQIKEELLDFPDKILELAKTYQEPFNIVTQEPVGSLVRLKERCFELVPEEPFIKIESKPKTKHCIHKLLKGCGEGERNEALCRLTSFFRLQGYSSELAYEFIHAWNKFNSPPDDFDSLKSTFKSIWQGEYSYGCYDWLLDTYCDKDCFLYSNKSEKIVKEDGGLIFHDFIATRNEYDKFVTEGGRIKLGISEKIDELIKGIAPEQVGVILGRPTAFKSTIAMHIGQYFVNNYPGYFLYVSLEMSLAMMYERQMQILTGKTSDFIETNYKTLDINENMKRFLITDKVDISVIDLERAILDFQEKKGEKIEFVVIDFLHALRASASGDTRGKVEEVVKQLTNFPRKIQTRLIYLAHVHRTLSKDDDIYLPLKLGSGKDTSMIENNAFFLFGTHLIRDDPTCVIFQLLKNKNGEAFPTGIKLFKQNNSIQLKEQSTYLPFDEDKPAF